MFVSCLAFDIFCEDDTGFIITLEHVGIYLIIKEFANLHIILCCMFWNNVVGFSSENRDHSLLFAISRYYGSINKVRKFYY